MGYSSRLVHTILKLLNVFLEVKTVPNISLITLREILTQLEDPLKLDFDIDYTIDTLNKINGYCTDRNIKNAINESIKNITTYKELNDPNNKIKLSNMLKYIYDIDDLNKRLTRIDRIGVRDFKKIYYLAKLRHDPDSIEFDIDDEKLLSKYDSYLFTPLYEADTVYQALEKTNTNIFIIAYKWLLASKVIDVETFISVVRDLDRSSIDIDVVEYIIDNK